MKSSTNIAVMLPLLSNTQLVMLRVMNINESRAIDFKGYCISSLFFVTFCFFFIELMWFFFRSKIVKLNSFYPFWQAFLKQVTKDIKEAVVTFGWITFVSFMWAIIIWGADFFTEESVVHFGVYLTLSLLLNFYLAALFSVWHLFLAPRLLALSQTKGRHLSP